MSCNYEADVIEVDIDALRRKYHIERDRRLRPEGERQYVEAGQEFADYYEADPYTPAIERPALSTDIDVAILGGGFAGLTAAAHLSKQGIDDFRIIDMAGDFGGTWYWNRYPGIRCDVDSRVYMPMLEDTGHIPTEKYASGAEIFAQCQAIGRHYDLYGKALFGTLVRSLRWDEDLTRWRITTHCGDDVRARFLIMASGPFNRPKLPGIEGIEDFAGHSFHTARWDYAYTGGGPNDPVLDKLAGKKVAIIGTGATGIQCIPVVARNADHLYVVQRTPSAVAERGNRPIDLADQSLHPGWQQEWQSSFHRANYYGIQPGETDIVCDGWTLFGRRIAARIKQLPDVPTAEQLLEIREQEDYQLMESIRQRVDTIIADPDTAAKLKAYYRYGCKRPTFSDDYLSVFARDNVTLLDVSASRGLERITQRGIVAGGREYPVDCLIFASGFEITTSLERRFGIAVIEGRGARSLYDHWGAGFRTLHGLMANGFPNQFFTGFIQGGVSLSIPQLYDRQCEHIAYIIKTALDRNLSFVEPSEQAQNDWVTMMHETKISNEAFLRECTPGYFNNEGGSTLRSFTGEIYAPGFDAFVQLLADWRTEGSLEGLVMHRVNNNPI